MTGIARLRVIAASGVVLIGGAVLFTGARATAQDTTRCHRPAAVAAGPVAGHRPAQISPRAVGHGVDRSWRRDALRVAGCSAWQRMHHRAVNH